MIPVTCPQCSKSYQLGDDKAGRVFLCQMCGGKVRVLSARGAKVSDPSAPDDAIPEAIPEAIPLARTRGSSSKSSSVGGNGLLIGIGFGAAFFAIVGGVLVWVLRDRNPPSRGERIDDVPARQAAVYPYEYLPPNPPIVLQFSGAAIWQHEHFRELFGAGYDDNSFAQLLVSHTGIHPEELQVVYIALQVDDQFSSSGTRWLAAVDLKSPFDWTERTHPRFMPREFSSTTIFELAGVFERDYAVWQPQENMLVFGDVGLVEGCIGREPARDIPPMLNMPSRGGMLDVVVDVAACPWLKNQLDEWHIPSNRSDNWKYLSLAPRFASSGSQFNPISQWTAAVSIETIQIESEEELKQLAVEFLSRLNITAEQHVNVTANYVQVTLRNLPAVHDEIQNRLLGQIAELKRSIYFLAGEEPPSPLVAEGMPYVGDE